MAETAELLIVGRMRDEISQVAKSAGTNVEQATKRMRSGTAALSNEMANMRIGLVAAGSALMMVGALLNRLDNPMTKVVSHFAMIAGGVLNSTAAMLYALPQISKLIAMLRTLAITQAVVAALSGPVGWASLAVAAAIGGAAFFGTAALTSRYRGAEVGPRTLEVQKAVAAYEARREAVKLPEKIDLRIIGGPLIMSDEKDMAKLADAITEAQRRRARGTVGRLP